ncbi:MAG TPA: trigger factor [Verrucomicrobiae bacterium]|nr:trigger factor [Verrucomicrobiae bacterium]
MSQSDTTAETPTEAHIHEPKKLGECEREISVEIAPEAVSGELESFVARYQKMARVPGFRRGKTPASVIRRRFAEELKQEVVESLVPKYFREEVQKLGLQPISQPRVTDFHFEESEPLRFKAVFEILPAIELAPYNDLRSEKQPVGVTDEEVDRELNSLREHQASYISVEEDRGLQDGDFAETSFTGTPVKKSESGLVDPAGNPVSSGQGQTPPAGTPPVQMNDVLVDIGGSNTVPEFSDNLRGAKAGEERSFQIAYPEDFQDKRLAGKTLDYKVQVKAIKKKQIPELNDEFARELGDFKSIDELRTRIREQIEAQKKHDVEHAAKDKLVEELVKRNEFPVPESLLERQVTARLERGFRALAAQGMRADDMRKMDFGRLRTGQREAAFREVKASLILEKIADKENIQTSDEELNTEVERLAHQGRQPVEAVRKKLEEEGALERMRERIRNEKTLDFLYQRSA